MQPQTAQKNDGLKQKYRVFHPQATVWLKNPFDHDVIFQVADELNRPFRYRLPAKKTSELPGGAVATLGLKAIVDELIQSSNAGKDALSIWDLAVRAKYEKDVVLRVKEAPLREEEGSTGEINLGVKQSAVPEADEEGVVDHEEEFPGLDNFQPGQPTQPTPEPTDGNDGPAPDPAAANARQAIQSGVDSQLSALPATTILEDAAE